MKETHKITVDVDGRKFICHMHDAEFLRIYERVTLHEGRPYESIADKSRWHWLHNASPKRGLIRRVMDAAIAANKPF